VSQEIQVRRAKRGDLAAITALVREVSQSRVQMDEAVVMEWLFSKGLWVAVQRSSLVAVAAWQAENLVSVTDVFYVSPQVQATVASRLLETIESEAATLMCEVSAVVLPKWSSEAVRSFLQQRGYEPKAFQELHRIWREVLGEFVTSGTDLMVKRLRDRMVMVPL
jgi:N-acetylglutamate synthase-like GNAT family acetyltransferase